MAIWQFNVYFIPRQTLLDKYGQVPSQFDFEESLTIPWWLNLNLDVKKIFPLLQEFGSIQEWTLKTEGLRSFGDTDANDISVCYNCKTDIIEELSCRIDIRNIDENVVCRIFFIATQFDCILMDNKGLLFQPTFNSLLDRIQDSNASRFSTDSKPFLDDCQKAH